MTSVRRCIAVTASLVVVSCVGDTTAPRPGDSIIRVINASPVSLDVAVDGLVLVHHLAPSVVSRPIGVAPGPHQIRLISEVLPAIFVTVPSGNGATVVAVSSPNNPTQLSAVTAVLPDTERGAPPRRSRLRLAHFARSGSGLQAWRTQPDFVSPTPIPPPFGFGTVTPYFEGDAGTWEVWLAASGAQTRSASAGQLLIPGGQRRTLVLVDSAHRIVFRLLPD